MVDAYELKSHNVVARLLSVTICRKAKTNYIFMTLSHPPWWSFGGTLVEKVIAKNCTGVAQHGVADFRKFKRHLNVAFMGEYGLFQHNEKWSISA